MALLGIQVFRQNQRIDDLAASTNRTGLEQAAASAAIAPGARTVRLESTDRTYNADAVVLPDGRGYLVQFELPALAADQTYQLWGVYDDRTVSLGILGSDPTVAAFVADGPVKALAITAERQGGVVSSSQSPVVAGPVT
jgi:hypothetical protein